MQILILPSGAAATTPVASTPITPVSMFSYHPPVITGIAVVRARFTNQTALALGANATSSAVTDSLAVPCPFPVGDPFWSCAEISNASLLMVVIEVGLS